MNESASKASLASSSGKPSTANSTGSNGRKTRTIVVARTIPDEPANVTPTAPQASTAAVVNQQHSRDVRSGKLASYAALGGAEDVARFDHFLAEQRGQHSASELRAAATSPHHMQASMKRKSMNLIQLEGMASEAEPTGEDAAMRKLMQQELESDARKRREEAVAHRKWLNSLPIHERVAQQRQQNALRKWRQMNRDWEAFKVRAARRLGKAPQELVMSRAAAYREQREMYDALQKARPLSDKVGGDIWLVGLRNEGTRYVPVGNIFSGLFCPIRESTKLGPSVRRPLDYYANQQEHEHDASRPLSKLERRSLDLLARKKWRLRKQLQVLQPHEVEHSSSSHLAVGTQDLFAWASGTTEHNNPEDDDDEGSVRMYSAGMDEASRRRRLRSYASPSSPKAMMSKELGSHFKGPSLRIAHVAEAGEEPIPATAASGAAPLSPLRLSFYTPVGEQEQRSLSIANDGATVVHYQWWRAPFEDDDAELTSQLRGRRTRREEQELERSTTTSVSKLGGTLLPGETQAFVFTFESSRAGVFLEKWLLDAEPRPRIGFGSEASHEDLPVEVRLRGVAHDNFAAWRRREKQLARVEQRASHFFVATLVDEILDGVRPPEAVAFSALSPREALTTFYAQNGSAGFSDVYFSPRFISGCHALYERAQGVLRALTPVQLPVAAEDETTGNGVDVGASEGVDQSSDAPPAGVAGTEGPSVEADSQQEAEKAPSPPAHLSEEWDWRLETLREVCKMADEAQQTQIGRLTRELKKEIEDVEEDDNEDDENEEDGEEEEDEDEESGEGEDIEKAETTAEKSPCLSPREIRANERLARRQGLEAEISALLPNLQETFDTMRYSACTAPYSSARLQERLHERLGSLASETPVVCEIAKAMHASDDSSVVQAAKIDGVAKLLVRAIDEAVGGDLAHQTLFGQERRRLQRMWLADKASYLSIPELMTTAKASTSRLPQAMESVDGTEAASPEVVDDSGVLLLQVDLDLAPWFSLVKVETKAAVPVDDAPRRVELAWRFSPDLTQHSSFVPAKVVQAAESLENVLRALSSADPAVHTVILVSELSRPPLTKQMCRLLRSAAQADLNASVPAPSQASEAEEAKADGGGETEATVMKGLLQRLAPQLSLRGVAPVLQRAVQKDVVFCASVEEAQGQIDFGRKEQQLNASASLGGGENEAARPDSDAVPADAAMAPRLVLLEHLDAAGIGGLVDAARKRELASKPTTPAVPDTHKPAVGAGKKAPAAAPAKGKPGTPGTPATPVPAPAAEAAPVSTRDFSVLTATGKELTEQGVAALRSQLARMAKVCILDGIPSQQYEGVFAFAADSPKQEGHYAPPPVVAGPALLQEVQAWSQTLQPMLLCSDSQPRALTAIVGGRSLESKLRLIDGLLEVAHEIYFVGQVAMSLYRVLHTKQVSASDGRGAKPIEEEDELEEDAEAAGDHETILEEVHEKAADARLPPGRARPAGLWDLLVPAVEKLQQKASRNCVRLMLPIDWVVGDTSLEEQDLSSAAVVEDDDEEEEEEAEEEEGEDRGRKSRKRRASEIKSARQKPLVEPDGVDVFEQKQHATYEGERAHVVLSQAHQAPNAGWRTFADVSAHCLANARVAEGKASVLKSLWFETDDADEEGEDGLSSTPAAKFAFEWTFRALDVGPIAMGSLASLLSQETSRDGLEEQGLATSASRVLIVNGVCGAVDFFEYCAGTKQLLGILQGFSQRGVFIAGTSTAEWLRQLEIEEINNTATRLRTSDANVNSEESANTNASSLVAGRPRKVVDERTMRNARVLKQMIAARPHLVIATLASTD
jgi:3-phosphoglycerate kinase